MEKIAVERPGTEVGQITVMARIREIGKCSNSVFLKWPKDAVVDAQVQDPAILEGEIVGVRFVIIDTEALAILSKRKIRKGGVTSFHQWVHVNNVNNDILKEGGNNK
jgi:hypothetical protein